MKILLRAYCANNFGDDLFVKVICERYPNHEFYLICDEKYRHVFNNISNLKFAELTFWQKIIYFFSSKINKKIPALLPNKEQIIFRTNRYDEYIYVGGSIYMERPWYKKEIKHEKSWYSHKPYILGCNFGPWTTMNFFNDVKNLLKKD